MNPCCLHVGVWYNGVRHHRPAALTLSRQGGTYADEQDYGKVSAVSIIVAVILFLLLLPGMAFSAAMNERKDAPHYAVVAEYIRSLGAIHTIQQISANEFQDDKDNVTLKMMSAIRYSTRIKLELSCSISVLREMKQVKNWMIAHVNEIAGGNAEAGGEHAIKSLFFLDHSEVGRLRRQRTRSSQ